MLHRIRSIRAGRHNEQGPPPDPELPDLEIVQTSIPFGTVDSAYPLIQFTTLNAVGTVDWSVSSGTTNGLPFSSTGALGDNSQTPDAPGEFIFAITARTERQSASLQLLLSVDMPVSMLNDVITGSVYGAECHHFFQMTGGRAPYTYRISRNYSPFGTDLNPNTGELFGTFNETGDFEFDVTGRDARGREIVRTITMTVAPSFSIATQSIPNVTIGTPVSFQLTSSGTITDPSWALLAQPGWMVVSTSGLITGIPTGSPGQGSCDVVLRDDATGDVVQQHFTFSIIAAASTLAITTPSLTPARVGTAYTGQSIVVTGNTGAVTHTLPVGPAWLVVNSSSGALTGTPGAGLYGDFTVTARATDSLGYVERTWTLRVLPAVLMITTTSLSPAGTVGVLFDRQIVISGGVPPYSVAIPSGMGVLPSHLQITGNGSTNNRINGIPDTVEIQGFTLRVTDNGNSLFGTGNVTDDQNLVIQINAAVVISGDNWADRAFRSNITRRVRFDLATDVDNYIRLSGTYAAHPEYAIRTTDPARLVPGATGCMELTIPHTTGVVDVRNNGVQLVDSSSGNQWNGTTSYAQGWHVLRNSGGSNKCWRSLIPGNLNHTPPTTTTSDAFWEYRGEWDSLRTADTSVSYLVKLNSAWETTAAGTASFSGSVMTVSAVSSGAFEVGMAVLGSGIPAGVVIGSFGTGTGGTGTYNLLNGTPLAPISLTLSSRNVTASHVYAGYGPGSEFTVAWRMTFSELFCEARWEHNAGSGGNKMGTITSVWRHNYQDFQFYWATTRYNGAFHQEMQTNGGFHHFSEYERPPGINGAPSNYPYQPKVNRLTAGDHPVTKFSAVRPTLYGGQRIVDPTVGTTVERDNKRYGNLFFDTDPNRNPAALNRPEWFNPDSGGILLPRDCPNVPFTMMTHIKYGTDGGFDSLIENYIAMDGFDFELISRAQNVMIRSYEGGQSPGDTNIAYGNPGALATRDMGLSALWIDFANTARITETLIHSTVASLGQQDCKVWVHEILAASGPVLICAPGFSVPPVSTVQLPTYIPATPGQVVTSPAVRNGNTGIYNVIPADWMAITGSEPGHQEGRTGVGRKVWSPDAYSGLVADYEHGLLWAIAMSGHAAGNNDMIAYFDCNGTLSAPEGWVFVSASDPDDIVGGYEASNNPSGTATFLDGLGASRIRGSHRYGGGCRVPDGRIFVMFGSPHPEGGERRGLLSFNPATGTHTFHGTGNSPNGTGASPGTFQSVGGQCIYCPEYGVVLCINRGDGIYAVFNPFQNTWVRTWTFAQSGVSPSYRNFVNSPAANASMLYWPASGSRLGEVLFLGSPTSAQSSSSRRCATFNGNTMVPIEYTFTGDPSVMIGQYAPGVHRDPERGYAWGMPLSADTGSQPANANRVRLFRIAPGSANGTWDFAERLTNGESLITSGTGDSITGLPRTGAGRIMPLIGKDTLIVFDGNWQALPKFLRKPA